MKAIRVSDCAGHGRDHEGAAFRRKRLVLDGLLDGLLGCILAGFVGCLCSLPSTLFGAGHGIRGGASGIRTLHCIEDHRESEVERAALSRSCCCAARYAFGMLLDLAQGWWIQGSGFKGRAGAGPLPTKGSLQGKGRGQGPTRGMC